MLNFKIGSIVRSIDKSGVDLSYAAKEFFGTHSIYSGMPRWENISALFNEWLAFDYRLPSDVTIATWYYLKNPDHVSKELLHELQEIIQTQRYDLFELKAIDFGMWVDVRGLANGQSYHVLEKTLSVELQGKTGCFFNRLAKVNDDYYFIGSNPLLLPITYTSRSREFFRNSKTRLLTPKDALSLLIINDDKK